MSSKFGAVSRNRTYSLNEFVARHAYPLHLNSKLVRIIRIELMSGAYESPVLPLNDTRIKLVAYHRVELCSPDSESGVIPIYQ